MPDSGTRGHEERDVNARAVAWFACGLVATLATIFIVLHFFESALAGGNRTDATRNLRPQAEVPPPRLQTDPSADLANLRAADAGKLHSYGWIDRPAGVIHIPIERAIELTAVRGLPARAEKGIAP